MLRFDGQILPGTRQYLPLKPLKNNEKMPPEFSGLAVQGGDEGCEAAREARSCS
jgi:hypothetical protein